MSKNIETSILAGLCYFDGFSNKFFPFVKEDHFKEQSSKHLFRIIANYINKYDEKPGLEAIAIELGKYEVDEEIFEECKSQLGEFKKSKKLHEDYLIDQAEEYIKERSIYNALMESIEIVESNDIEKQKSIPEILTDALSQDFTADYGMDFYDDAERRFEQYHEVKDKIRFHLPVFNQITKGGAEPKTLNAILAGTNVGKTAMLCDFAAGYMLQGYNVLYITCEMQEKKIYQRIESNLYDITMDELLTLNKEKFLSKVNNLKEKSTGNLVVKEYPTSMANTNHVGALLKDLKLKKKFVPDVVCVDYINLLQSSRYSGGNHNSYTIVKAIAEELRGLSIKHDFCGWTATQLNRDGFASSDVDLTHTSESFGLPATVDFMFAALTSDSLKQQGKLAIQQLKSRYDDIGKHPKFMIGVDFEKMQMKDLSQSTYQSPKDSGVDQQETYEKFKKHSSPKRTSGLKVD